MNILLVGGYGTIGKRIAEHYASKHQLFIAGRNSGDVQVDIADSASIKRMYDSIEPPDAVICAAGEASWKPFSDLSEEDYYVGIRSKMMGQVNLVRIGQNYVSQGGSFTLTTGILADDPVELTASAAMVNGAIHSFVQASSLELQKNQRINVVSSGLVADAVGKYQDYFPGHNPVPMQKVVNGYVRSVEGKRTGQVIRIYD